VPADPKDVNAEFGNDVSLSIAVETKTIFGDEWKKYE